MQIPRLSTDHYFGGSWTEIKLDILRKYLQFYTTALKKQNFELLYIDAFAGSGSRTEDIPEAPFFSESAQKLTYDGSAKIALDIDPAFDRYLFVEKNAGRCEALSRLKQNYPERHIQIDNNDANQVIQTLANKPIWYKNKYRGVIFLDPYGNQIEWQTLEAIASTKTFDVWLLFPLSGVYRQTPLDHRKLEDYKKDNLNKLFGTDEWETAFYTSANQMHLFDEDIKHRITVKEIEQWIKARLRTCFPHVSEPLPLPQKGAQLFSLFFCVSNDSGKAIGLALKAANHLLKQHE